MPIIVAVIGGPGSGKSTIIREILRAPGSATVLHQAMFDDNPVGIITALAWLKSGKDAMVGDDIITAAYPIIIEGDAILSSPDMAHLIDLCVRVDCAPDIALIRMLRMSVDPVDTIANYEGAGVFTAPADIIIPNDGAVNIRAVMLVQRYLW